MKHIVIIGGGASGIVAAIYASKGNKVTIIEKNSECGKKILVTGNGRCNYWNEDQNISHYHSFNKDVLSEIITDKNEKEILSLFSKIGIIPRIKNGYYYPYSNQAVTIKNALLLEAKLNGVEIINDVTVSKIVKEDSKFIINPLKENILADSVILAIGSVAAFKEWPDSGYDLAKSFGHHIIKPLPALVQLYGQGKHFKAWNGIRCDVKLELYENDNKVKEQYGEIQLTDYGISGICVFNLSGMVSRGLDEHKEEVIKINFVPWLDVNSAFDFTVWLDKRNDLVIGRNISQLLEGFLNYKLVKVLLELSKINSETKWEELSQKEKLILAKNIYEFNQIITKTKSFDKAQVCSGGVPISEINPQTMESLKVPDLYLTGELLDVDGDCGGYNLGFAFLSGMIAGKATNR